MTEELGPAMTGQAVVRGKQTVESWVPVWLWEENWIVNHGGKKPQPESRLAKRKKQGTEWWRRAVSVEEDQADAEEGATA